MIYFKHCRECKPPKRYPGCSGVCEDYKKDRERYDADMAKNHDKTAASANSEISFFKSSTVIIIQYLNIVQHSQLIYWQFHNFLMYNIDF